MPDRRRIKEVFGFTILLVLLLGALLFVCDTADARAGGGQGYSGGGGSSGSGSRGRSSGGGGDAQLVFFLIRLIFHYPAVGIPVTIVVIIIAAKGYNKGNDAYVDYTIVKAAKARPDNYARDALSELKKRDPAFDENFFLGRARKAFELIQHAWTQRDLSHAQTFLSDGVFEQFTLQIEEMREKKIIDHLEGLQIEGARPVKFQSDRNFDVVHVRIDARAINYRKDEKTGRLLEGSKNPEPFAEVWSFLRKPGVKTLKKPGLIEGQCPNCGNPIKIGRLSKCDVCSSLLRSGEHDWVLAGITQACEWSSRPDRAIPGLKEFVASDPGFNMQHIEDRVSVMFWRKLEAERKGNVAPLRKIARNDFCEGQMQWYKPDKGGARRFYTNCAVGAIDLLGIETAEPDDHIYVEVVWSGRPSILTPNNGIEAAPRPINFRHVFVLGRSHGALTSSGSSLTSSHCPSCGAPEQTGAENECSYCGSVMNDGKQDWVLEAVVDRSDAQVSTMLIKIAQTSRQLAAEAHKPQSDGAAPAGATDGKSDLTISGLELIRWTVAMMLADGVISEKEMELITGIARQRDVQPQLLQRIIAELKSVPSPIEHVMQTSKTAADKELLRQLARVALADGKLSDEEVAMLKTVGAKLEMGDADIDLLLKRERRNLFQEAKETLRQSRRS